MGKVKKRGFIVIVLIVIILLFLSFSVKTVSAGWFSDLFHKKNFESTAKVINPIPIDAFSWQSGMVSWWKFDGNAYDSLGINQGTVFGATLIQSNCISGQCYRFDGINDYVEMSSLSQSYPKTTYSYWVKNDFEIEDITTGSYESLFYYRNGRDYGLFFGDGRFVANFHDSAGAQHYVPYSPSTINKGEWHHIVNVYDADTGYVALYIDGKLAGSRSYSSWNVGTKSALRIGSYWSHYYNGSIDEFMIWNRSLTSVEVSQLYDSFSSSCITNCSGKQCGDDGCGGSCGSCASGYSCTSTGQCILPYNTPSWQSGMVSWWKFDGNAYDSLNLMNGIPNGPISVNSGCASKQCYSFDGINDYISLKYSPAYNIREAITLSIWIKRTTNYNQTRDVMLLSRPPSWYFYDAYNSGMIRGDVYINGVRRAGLYSKIIPYDNNWYNIIYTYNSSTGISMMYQNGILIGSTQLTGLSNYLIDNSTSNFPNIGYQTLGRGLILDEFMIWNRSLTSVEVSQLYDSFSSSCITNCSGKQCGDDGCGGSCGSCASGYSCTSTGQCIALKSTLKEDGSICNSDLECKSGACDYDIFTENYVEGKIKTNLSYKYCHSSSSKCLFYQGWMQESEIGCTRCASWDNNGIWDDFIDTCGYDSKWVNYIDCSGSTPYCNQDAQSNSCNVSCVECRKDEHCLYSNQNCIDNKCVINNSSWKSGIILWLKMEDNALDSSTYKWSTKDGGVNYVSGKVGKAATGFSNTKQIFVNPNLDFASTNMTLSFWMNVKDYNLPARQNPLGKAYGGDGTITLEKSGYMNFYFGSAGKDSTPYILDTSAHTATRGVWEHWVITRDITSRKTQWYKEGVVSGPAYTYSPNYNPVHSTNNLTIGDSYVYPLNGSIDEVMIWNRVLNSEEVSQLYNSFSSSCIPNCSGKQCGDDGCGGSCGSCASGYFCSSAGWCVIEKPISPLTINIFTTKKVYSLGETIYLKKFLNLTNLSSSPYSITGLVIDTSNTPEEINTNVPQNSVFSYITQDNTKTYSRTVTETNINGELKNDFSEFNLPSSQEQEVEGFKAYIIEFEDAPVIKEFVKLDKQAKENAEEITKSSSFIRIFKKTLMLMPDDVPSKVEKYSSDVQNNNEKIKSRISNELVYSDEDFSNILNANVIQSFFRKVTGKAITNENNENIIYESKLAFNGVVMDISYEQAQKIKNVEGVKRVYPNYKVEATLMNSVPLINADDFWKLDADGNNCSASGKECLTGKGITIGIIDTGIDYTHPDLGGCFGNGCKVAGGYDFVNNDNDPMDDMGHGTHCAAIAGGNGVLKGVAPDATLYSFKVLSSSGGGYNDDIIAAIERSIDLNNNGIPMEDENDYLDIISLSLGGQGNPDDPMSQAIDNVVNAGIVAVVAAGNSGPAYSTIQSPGTSRKAITVGAISVNQDGAVYVPSFSSIGPVIWTENGVKNYMIKPDVVAPGENICAAEWDNFWSDRKCLDDNHVELSGTSMATPHVSGLVALLKQKHLDWTPEQIKNSLKSTSYSLGYSNENIEGHGVINASSLLNLQSPPIDMWDFAFVSPFNRVHNVFDVLEIKAVFPEDYDSLILEYVPSEGNHWMTEGVTIVGSNNTIARVDPSVYSEGGTFSFMATITKNGVTKLAYTWYYFDKELKKGWPTKIGSVESFGGAFSLAMIDQPAIYDIDNDGKNEMIFSYGMNERAQVSVFNEDGTQVEGFPLYLMRDFYDYGSLQYGPLAGDYDGDGYGEIILVGTPLGWGSLFKIEHNGTYEKSLFTTAGFVDLFSDDLNYDESFEIFGIDYYNDKIYLTSSNLTSFYGWPLSLLDVTGDGKTNGRWFPTVFSMNVDGNLNKEIIAEYLVSSVPGSWSNDNYTKIYAFNLQGQIVEGWPKIYDEKFYCTVQADFDKDGETELICFNLNQLNESKELKITLLSSDGNIKNQFSYIVGNNFEFWGDTLGYIGDFNGERKIVLVAKGLGVYFVDANGKMEILKEENTYLNVQFYAIGNLDSTNSPYISLGNGYPSNDVVFINPSNMQNVSKLDFSVGTYVLMNSPVIADIDNDEKNELIFVDSNNYVYVYDTEGKVDNQWGEVHYDSKHSNCYDCDEEQSIIYNPNNFAVMGQLKITIQKKVIGGWFDHQKVIDTSLTIPAYGKIDLANGDSTYSWNSRGIYLNSTGSYRVYATFTFGTEVYSSYSEFEVK